MSNKIRCIDCIHCKTYTTGRDEYPPCATLAYCAKEHWENGTATTVREEAECDDFVEEPLIIDTVV